MGSVSLRFSNPHENSKLFIVFTDMYFKPVPQVPGDFYGQLPAWSVQNVTHLAILAFLDKQSVLLKVIRNLRVVKPLHVVLFDFKMRADILVQERNQSSNFFIALFFGDSVRRIHQIAQQLLMLIVDPGNPGFQSPVPGQIIVC